MDQLVKFALLESIVKSERERSTKESELLSLLAPLLLNPRSKGYSQSEMESKGLTLLHVACKSKKSEKEIRDILDENPVLLDKKDKKGRTALWEACNSRNYPVMRTLLERGADPCVQGWKDLTPFGLFIADGDITGLAILCKHCESKGIDCKAAINQAARNDVLFRRLCDGKCVAMLDFILDKGLDADCVSEGGWTLLHCACKQGKQGIVVSLLNHGADVNAKKDDGFTPLHLAALNGHDGIAAFLLCKGADATILTADAKSPDERGKSALDLAKDLKTDAVLRAHCA